MMTGGVQQNFNSENQPQDYLLLYKQSPLWLIRCRPYSLAFYLQAVIGLSLSCNC